VPPVPPVALDVLAIEVPPVAPPVPVLPAVPLLFFWLVVEEAPALPPEAVLTAVLLLLPEVIEPPAPPLAAGDEELEVPPLDEVDPATAELETCEEPPAAEPELLLLPELHAHSPAAKAMIRRGFRVRECTMMAIAPLVDERRDDTGSQ
jgi:hypothetical protein